jgi:hypothetical protein
MLCVDSCYPSSLLPYFNSNWLSVCLRFPISHRTQLLEQESFSFLSVRFLIASAITAMTSAASAKLPISCLPIAMGDLLHAKQCTMMSLPHIRKQVTLALGNLLPLLLQRNSRTYNLAVHGIEYAR